MATHRGKILDYLYADTDGADDDVLAVKLRIPHRQSVNQVCRWLAAEGLIERRYDPVTRKIVNRLALRAKDADVSTSVIPSNRPTSATETVDMLGFANDGAVREFSYGGELRLGEDDVKQAVGAALARDGWTVDIRWGHAHGIDIEATRGDERLILEAKGEGSRPAMRDNYFIGALGELLQRMDSPDAYYGLALPAHRQFTGLILRLPALVRSRLRLRFFLVRPATAGYEIGLVLPGAEADGS